MNKNDDKWKNYKMIKFKISKREEMMITENGTIKITNYKINIKLQNNYVEKEKKMIQ